MECATDLETGRPDHFSRLITGRNSACHVLSLPVAMCDRSRNQGDRSFVDRSPVERIFYILSFPVTGCYRSRTGRYPVEYRSKRVASRSTTGRIPVECMSVPQRATGWWFINRSTGYDCPVAYRSISGRGNCFLFI